MPMDSIGVDIKMSTDMDPKTYSPMSGSDENMSSPPSVLTTASAGSCTPSSLPSAGSTPSSIPSAGSTPYQFVSQEESTIIKPLTPSDHQSVHPATPDQPITPEPSVSSDLQSHELSDVGSCKKHLISALDNAECRVTPNSGSILEEVNERRENCPCIMCDNKQDSQIPPCKPVDVGIVKPDHKIKSTKGKSSKAKDGEGGKIRRKNRQNNQTVHYQSELFGGPESTGIRIKIKVASAPRHRSSSFPNQIPSQEVGETARLTSLDVPSRTLVNKSSTKNKGKRGCKRKSLQLCDGATSQSSSQRERSKKRKKPVEHFQEWGPIESEVKGEPQSPWGYNLPKEILEKIFLLGTYSQGCIPFLFRMSKVCRLWREVSILPNLWHTVDLSSGLIKNRFRNERKLLWILENRLTKVEDLNLGGWTEAICPLMLRRISEICPQLKHLNLSYCYKLHAENLHSLLYSSTKLQLLDLTGIMGTHKPTPRCAVGQQTLAELASSLTSQLTHLIVANNTLSNVPSIINSLAEYCHNLQVLDMSIVETIGRDLVRLDIEKLQSGCPLLRILRLANSHFRLTQSSMSVQVSSPGFPELEELSVAADGRNIIGMNDTELERILKNSNKLRLLDVRGCHSITDSSLVRIPPWDLEHLFLSGASVPKSYSDRLELVIRKWHHSLVELDLSWTGNSEAIDVALFALSEEENYTLQLLNLCGSSMSFEPVKKVLKNCHSLQWLNLTSCRALPRGVKRLHANSIEVNALLTSIEEGKFDEVSNDA